MRAYHVAEASGMIKLDAMENPYAWPEELKRQWLSAVRDVAINRYPDPGAAALKEQLRSVMNLPAGAGILLGNGSDELIQLLTLAVAQSGRTCLSVEPGFVMYRQIALTLNMDYHAVALSQDDFMLDGDAMLAAIASHHPALIFIAYPNNPTGNLFNRQTLIEIIRHAPGLVVIDEAYHAFARESFVPHIVEFENLLVMRTLSKEGLAGIRLGYLLGQMPGSMNWKKSGCLIMSIHLLKPQQRLCFRITGYWRNRPGVFVTAGKDYSRTSAACRTSQPGRVPPILSCSGRIPDPLMRSFWG
jgi:Histidinol-phosphate/aromatic aminotransferase and cobyric acid decarboxylase